MEAKEIADAKLLSLLKSGGAHILDSKSGIPFEDFYQFIYISNEGMQSEQSARLSEKLNMLKAVCTIKNLAFRNLSKKDLGLDEAFGLSCIGITTSA